MKTLLALAAAGLLAAAGPQDRKNRPFQMGASPMPHDMTPEGLAALMAFLNSHSDLVATKIDEGIPWQEALDGRPYAPEFEKTLDEKALKLENKKVFVSTTPLNGDKNALGDTRGAERIPRVGAWKARDFDDPNVIRAYLAYCRNLIARLRPDYFAYAMEVNALAKVPAAWKKYLVFAREVYTALKKENPTLPVFVTVSLETMGEAEQVTIQKKAVQEALRYSDLAGVVAFPFLKEANPARLPKDYFSSVAALAGGKPIAVAETCFPAEDLTLPGFERIGKPAWQQDYVRLLLDESARLNARFVVWTVPRDYDLLADRAGALFPEFFKIFRDAGLQDGDGKPRKSFELWEQWRKLPVAGR
jgi:hypothetical protein